MRRGGFGRFLGLDRGGCFCVFYVFCVMFLNGIFFFFYYLFFSVLVFFYKLLLFAPFLFIEQHCM